MKERLGRSLRPPAGFLSLMSVPSSSSPSVCHPPPARPPARLLLQTQLRGRLRPAGSPRRCERDPATPRRPRRVHLAISFSLCLLSALLLSPPLRHHPGILHPILLLHLPNWTIKLLILLFPIRFPPSVSRLRPVLRKDWLRLEMTINLFPSRLFGLLTLRGNISHQVSFFSGSFYRLTESLWAHFYTHGVSIGRRWIFSPLRPHIDFTIEHKSTSFFVCVWGECRCSSSPSNTFCSRGGNLDEAAEL